MSGVDRLAFTPEEAAASIGCSRSFFYEHVLPDLRVVRVGRRRIIPRESIEQWLREEASRAIR
jgi:excisionase family DNA binding protein